LRNCINLPGRDGLEMPPQVETLGAKILVGLAVAYIALVVVVPFVNVFLQVGCVAGVWNTPAA
jgi:hypothetical protein